MPSEDLLRRWSERETGMSKATVETVLRADVCVMAYSETWLPIEETRRGGGRGRTISYLSACFIPICDFRETDRVPEIAI